MAIVDGPCKRSVADLLFVWQGQLNDAKLNFSDAISAAEMMLALVVSNALPTKTSIHDFIEDHLTSDLHQFIEKNWEFLEQFRKPQRGKPQ